MIKEWNEITVMLKMPKEEAINQLAKKGYVHEISFNIYDYYYLPNNADLTKDTLILLNEMILIRQFNDKTKLTIKHKEYDHIGNIISQTNTDLPVSSVQEAKNFLKELGYKEVMYIKDEVYIMKKDHLGFVIEDVNDGEWLMLEIEENEYYPKIHLIKQKLDESGLLYDDSDFFVKKAQLIYDKQNKI